MTKFTDTYLRGLKPKSARYQTRDDQTPGLYIAVEPTGTKIFVHLFSFKGKSARLTLKPRYPALSLKEARLMVHSQRLQLANGHDPRGTDSDTKASSMDALCRAYLTSCRRRTREITWASYAHDLGLKYQGDGWIKTKNPLKFLNFEDMAQRRPETITKAEIMRLLDQNASQRGSSAAANLHATLKRLFAWLANQDMPSTSMMDKIESPLPRRPRRRRLLTSHETASIWIAAGELPTQERNIVRWLMLTGARRDQAAYIEFADLDQREKKWHVRGDKPGSKGVENFLPITAEMQAIIDECPHRDGFLFSRDEGRSRFVLREYTINKLRQILSRKGLDFPHWVFHDFRRVYRSVLSTFPIPHGDKVCEYLIGHVIPGVTSVYDLHGYMAEKRLGLELWAKWIHDAVDWELKEGC